MPMDLRSENLRVGREYECFQPFVKFFNLLEIIRRKVFGAFFIKRKFYIRISGFNVKICNVF